MRRHLRILCVLSVGVGATAVTATAAAQEPLFGATGDARTPSRLTVAVAADAENVAPGRSLTLRLDMVPAAGIHVYAPGNPDYIPVSVTWAPPPGVQVQPATYPPGEDYVFGELLKETVKVYSRAFQVRQPLVVTRAAAKRAGASITIAGAVRYQACDDRVCFPPATVPISITLPVAAAAPRGAAR